MESSSNSKERKRRHRWEQKNRWMAHYELKYGVVPTEFVLAGTDNGGSAVASATATTTSSPSAALVIDGIPVVLKAKCRFCECFGRESSTSVNGSSGVGHGIATTSASASTSKSRSGSAPEDDGEPDDAGDFAAAVASAVTTTNGSGAGGSGNELTMSGSDAPRASKRRKKRQTLKVFGPNFRTDNLESHLSREHAVKWREYERLRDSDKKDFFPDVPVFKEFLVAAAAAAAQPHASLHPQQQQQQQAQQQQAQQHLSSAVAAINLTSQLQQNALPPHHTDASVAAATAAAAAVASSTSTSSASAAGLMGFSPSGFLGGKMLSFTDKPQQQSGGGGSSSASGTQGSKHFVPVSVMDMVDQLLSSRAVAPTPGTSVENGASQSWWHQFVQMDATLDASTLPAPVDLKSIAAAGGDTFALTIRNDALFAFVLDAFRHGLSLDATLAMVHAAERYLLDPIVFGAVTRADVVACVRTVTGVNLAAISMLTAFAWGYAVLLRFVTRYSTGYVDVRVQVAVNDEVQDMHVLAVPVDAHKHSPEAVAAAVVRALTAVDARALEKIIGVTVDGDPYHMQKYKGVARLLRTEVARATNNAAFYVLHSGAYHINMVVEELLEICQEEFAILATVADLEALCAASASLMDEMGPEPVPRPHSAHWIHILSMCEWLALQREALTKWCHDHNELHHIPSNTSWVVVFLLRDILKDVYAVYVKCVEHASTFADVQRHLRELIFQLRLKFNVKTVGSAASGVAASDSGVVVGAPGDDVDDSVAASDAAMSAAVAASQSFLDLSEFSYQDFVNAVIPLDLFMYEAFQLKTIDGVGENERMHIHERFNALIFLLISKFQGLVSVSAESSASPPGSGVDASATSPFPDFHQYSADIPPSTPYELITMNNVAFMALLNSQQFRIRSKWAGKVLTMITEERNRMITEFSLRSSYYDAVSLAAKQQQQHGSVALRDAWRVTSVQFASLSGFAVAFGCLLAVPKREVAHHGAQPLSNVHLEAQLHAQQFDRLALLRKHFDTVV